MVIDKWTRTQNNKSLSTPLLGHKTKDNFSELKKEYERLQSLNRKFNKKSKESPQNAPDSMQTISEKDPTGINEYISQISSIFLSINEIISENNNYEIEEINTSVLKEINLIADKILYEYNIFLSNIKELENFENIYDFNDNLNLLSREIKNVIKNIKKKFKKDENEENNAIVQPQNRTYNFDRNIDR